jgi:hypothetical protein
VTLPAIENVHGFVVPEHGPLVHPAKTEPVFAAAVNETDVPD